jgi:septal ring factor EnvC (AmiA/AmiB activator)
MSANKSTAKSAENQNSWDAAIKHAKEVLRRVEDRRSRLLTTIKDFEESKSKGEPWIGTQAENQTTESCHSV